MQKYSSNIADARGNAFAFATVTVTDSTGALAQLYSANDVTKTMANPLTTDALSNFSFYAANGRYSWSASGTGFTASGITDFSLFDPADTNGAAQIGYGTDTVSGALDALHLADYTALRAYTGNQKNFYVTGYLATAAPSGIAGPFTVDDSDTTSLDNGGTIIVLANGKRAKRAYTGAVNVKWFAAKGGQTGDDAAAFSAAAAALGGSYELYAPADKYNLSTVDFGNQSNITLRGDGPGATLFYGLNTGSAAAAMLKFSATSSARVRIEGVGLIGNQLTGTSGNGHGISFLNTAGTGFAPQLLTLRDVHIEGFRGSGRDYTGTAMLACGIYGYLGTAAFMENVTIYSSSVALCLNGYQKAYVYNVVADTIDNIGAWLINSENIDFFGGILNRCGSGGATDGAVVRQGCSNINFYGTRLKDANPAIDNSRSTTFLNHDTTYFGCHFNQLASTGYNTIVDIGTGDSGFRIKGGAFKWTNVTAAVGVNVGNGPGGYQMVGLVVEDVQCSIGSGGTVSALVWVNNSAGVVQAPRFRGIQFGDGGSAGATTTMTNGIRLSGLIDSPIIEGPMFHAATNYVITNCVNIDAAGGNLINPVIIAPVYRNTGGTITNQLVNTTGATVTQIAGGIAASGNLRASTAAAGVASTTTLGATTATTVGAAGAASALPANPLGYIVGYVGTTQVKIPYYNA